MNGSIEEKFKKLAERLSEHIAEKADSAISDIYSDLVPYLEEDAATNAGIQAANIAEQIIAKNFDWDGDYILVRSVREHSPRVRIKFSEHDYDNLRDAIIERMPECPKDAKIKNLEDRIRKMIGPF